MTTNQKLATGVVIAGVAGVAAYFLFFRKGTLNKGTAHLGELAVANCNCFFNEYFPDGTIRSTKRPRQDCIDDGLDFVGCAGEGQPGFDPLDPSTWPVLGQLFEATKVGEVSQ